MDWDDNIWPKKHRHMQVQKNKIKKRPIRECAFVTHLIRGHMCSATAWSNKKQWWSQFQKVTLLPSTCDNVYQSENKTSNIPGDKYITKWYSVEHVGAGEFLIGIWVFIGIGEKRDFVEISISCWRLVFLLRRIWNWRRPWHSRRDVFATIRKC